MNERHPLYQAALDADENYSRVIQATYGKGATRWNLPYPLDPEVEAAYEAKKAADFEWLDHMFTSRIKQDKAS